MKKYIYALYDSQYKLMCKVASANRIDDDHVFHVHNKQYKIVVTLADIPTENDIIIPTIVKMVEIKYQWNAYSDDGGYQAESGYFNTKKECYNHMRKAALSKMQWNTEFDEDFINNGDTINYNVSFSQNQIIHQSYSGTYTYTIKEIVVK